MARRGRGAGSRPSAHARHDLVVIGGGPAGLAGALAAGVLGKRVALVERARHLGGALVNTGTIPSKTLRETALALSGLRSRELHGVDLSLRRGARVADFLHHERAVKRAARVEVAARLARLGIEHVQGRARFVGPQELEVTPARGAPRRLRARFVLIATGSRPGWPAEFPAGHPRVWDSDRILELVASPRSPRPAPSRRAWPCARPSGRASSASSRRSSRAGSTPSPRPARWGPPRRSCARAASTTSWAGPSTPPARAARSSATARAS